MANEIRILRSVGSTAPTGLAQGELAYVEASGTGDGRLYIGAAGATVEVVGGQYFIDIINSFTAFGTSMVTATDSAAGTALLDVATITVKGLAPILSNNAAQFLNGTGAYSTPAGGGDVSFDGGVAPADNALVRFDGVTGQIIQESAIIIDDSENVTGMGTLNTKTIANLVSTTDTGAASWTWIIDEDTMSSNSDTHVPTQQSVKAYVDSAVTGALTHKGGYNAATDTPALDTGSPVLVLGDMYTVTVAGTFFTEVLEVGDVLISDVDSIDAAALSDWTIVQKNLVAASATEAGYVTAAAQSFGGDKTFEGVSGDDATAILDSFVIDGGTF